MANRSDNFNRTDSSSSLGTPSDGGGGYTISSSSTWGITSNKAYIATSSGVLEAAVLEASSANVTVEAKFVEANGHWVIARYIDSSNYLYLQSNGSDLRIFKVVAGSLTQIAGWVGTINANDVMKFEVTSANDLTGYQNGVSRLTVNDSANSTGTKHGIGYWATSGTGTTWDDLTITDLNPSGNPAFAYAQQQ